MQTLSFNLAINSIPVELIGGDGKPSHYTLQEMPAATRDKYMQGLKVRFEINPDGTTRRLTNFVAFQAELITLCLFNEKGERVPSDTIQTWPGRVVGSLFSEAQKLNQLSEETKEIVDEAKKG